MLALRHGCRPSARFAAVVAFAMVATSFGSGGGGESSVTDPPGIAPVTTDVSAPSTSPPSDLHVIAGLVDTMREGGITVVADDQLETGGAAPVSLPEWQAENLARQVSIGGGVPGQLLRERFPVPSDAVPVDALIAAWLTMDLPGAEAARDLLDDPVIEDPALFVYPWAVVNLFIKDLAAAGSSDAPVNPAGDTTADDTTTAGDTTAGAAASFPAQGIRTADGLARSADPCGAVQAFYESTIGATIKALEGSDSLLGQIAGAALSLFVDKLGAAVSAAIPAAVKVIVQAVGVAAAIAAAVEPWSAALGADPQANAKGIAPDAGNPGKVTLTVVTGANDWPGPVKSCASLAGVELPQLDPDGAAVSWTLVAPGLADETDRDGTITPAGGEFQAIFDYVTRVETVGSNAQEVEGTAVVDGQVTRNDRDALIKVLGVMVGTALRGLPPSVVVPLAQLAATELAGLLEVTDPIAPVAIVPIAYHITPQDSTGSTLPDLSVPSSEPDPIADCVGVVLASEGRGGASGVLLKLNADGTGVFDFGQAMPYQGAVVRGILTFTWTGGPTSYSTTAGEGMLGVLVDIGGVSELIEMAPEDIATIAQPEQLRCVDGTITIERTGEVYS